MCKVFGIGVPADIDFSQYVSRYAKGVIPLKAAQIHEPFILQTGGFPIYGMPGDYLVMTAPLCYMVVNRWLWHSMMVDMGAK